MTPKCARMLALHLGCRRHRRELSSLTVPNSGFACIILAAFTVSHSPAGESCRPHSRLVVINNCECMRVRWFAMLTSWRVSAACMVTVRTEDDTQRVYMRALFPSREFVFIGIPPRVFGECKILSSGFLSWLEIRLSGFCRSRSEKFLLNFISTNRCTAWMENKFLADLETKIVEFSRESFGGR
jgi:hypothetical protein